MKGWEKDRVRRHTRDAIKTGLIAKPDACEHCGDGDHLHAHHTDYSDHLAVVFLCPPCHMAAHRRLHHIRWLGEETVKRFEAHRAALGA